MFHLLVAVIDPYTNESAWILPVAERVLTNFQNADCRVGWVVTADEYDAKAFLGPLADEHLTFVDRDREFVKALELKRLPALVHVAHDLSVPGLAQGWNPEEWRSIVDQLADDTGWNSTNIPIAGDPVPFDGSPADG